MFDIWKITVANNLSICWSKIEDHLLKSVLKLQENNVVHDNCRQHLKEKEILEDFLSYNSISFSHFLH